MIFRNSIQLLLILILLLAQNSFGTERHYVRHDPGHFCWGAGIDAEVHRGALYGRTWINDFVGLTVKIYTEWDMEGTGALGELLIKVPLKSGIRPYATVGAGYHAQYIDTLFNDLGYAEWVTFQTFRYGGGVEYRFGENQRHGLALEMAYFDGGSDYYSYDSSGTSVDSTKHTYEVQPFSAGLQYTFYYCGTPKKDDDDDGFHNRDENCPYSAEDFDGFRDEDGCPDYDNDMDDIPDSVDQCLNDAEDFDGFEDEDGCPDFNNDGDALPDSLDECPNEIEDIDQFQDEDGCPEVDNDEDGVSDQNDNCPTEAEDRDGFEDGDGCPEEDNDKDGIPDQKDKCPNEAENFNGLRDEDGCRDTIIEISRKALVLRSVTFEPDSDSLRIESYKTLEDVVHSLKLWAEVRIEIQGHTDAVGSAQSNMVLSQRRADIIKGYFIKEGIAEERLKAVGYGETVPVGDNDTNEGRALNRRVELKKID